MRKRILTVLLYTSLMSMLACSEQEEDGIKDPDAIKATWRLTQVVNISDEEKYLNSILQIEPNRYTHFSNDGNILSEGTWRIDGIYLVLQFSLFDSGQEIRYRLMQLSSENLSLEEHYTKDNKDALLEYHFIQVE